MRALALLAIAFGIVIPLVFGVVANNFATGMKVADFALGPFPASAYDVYPGLERESPVWLFMGVLARALVVFGFPTLVGIAIALALEERHKLLRERLDRVEAQVKTIGTFLGQRDRALEARLLFALGPRLKEGRIGHDELKTLVHEVFLNFNLETHDALGKAYDDALSQPMPQNSTQQPHASQ